MDNLPRTIDTVEQLEEVLSRPSPRLVEFLGSLAGDLLVIGADGKIGPTLVRMAQRAFDAAGRGQHVIAVDVAPMPQLQAAGARTIICDLLDGTALKRLPQTEDCIYMVGRKFGSTGAEHLTWAVNVLAAARAAEALGRSRVVAFSTGCVYPIVRAETGGAAESTPPEPIGEYSMSCLGRERMFDYFSHAAGLRVLHFRLNYAVELRYGVLADVARKVFAGAPLDVTTGFANVLWQGDVCERAILCLDLAGSPAVPLNVTGPEILHIRELGERFGKLLGRPSRIVNQENGLAFLSNAARSIQRFGPPSVPVDQVIEWVAHWVRMGGSDLGKPTHFETQDGKY